MNRLEVLLEALKEVDRHVEEMCKQHGHSYPASVEARQRAGEIEGAILAAKDSNGNVAQRTERDGSNIEDAGSIPATPANPALENVLAKLQATVRGMVNEADSRVISAFCAPFLTLGDLRRWVESENVAGSKCAKEGEPVLKFRRYEPFNAVDAEMPCAICGTGKIVSVKVGLVCDTCGTVIAKRFGESEKGATT